MKYEYDGSFLKSWPPLRRGVVGNYFYDAVRRGAKDVEALLDAVEEFAQGKFNMYGDAGNEGQDLRVLLSLIDDLETRKFAEYVLWRESLSLEERRRLKSEAGSDYRAAWMAQKPPTAKQLKYLEALACHIVPANMQEASQLIEKYKNGNAI